MAEVDLLLPNAWETSKTDNVFKRDVVWGPNSRFDELCCREIGETTNKWGQIEDSQITIAIFVDQVLFGIHCHPAEVKNCLRVLDVAVFP